MSGMTAFITPSGRRWHLYSHTDHRRSAGVAACGLSAAEATVRSWDQVAVVYRCRRCVALESAGAEKESGLTTGNSGP